MNQPLKKITSEILPINKNNPKKDGLGAIVSNYLVSYFQDHNGVFPASGLYDLILKEVEKPLFVETLRLVKGNQKKASDLLGINRNTLRKKLKELDIDSKETK